MPWVNEVMGKAERGQLTSDARCKELAIYSKKDMRFKSPLEEMLTDQFMACHKLSMKILGQIYDRAECEGISGVQRHKRRKVS